MNTKMQNHKSQIPLTPNRKSPCPLYQGGDYSYIKGGFFLDKGRKQEGFVIEGFPFVALAKKGKAKWICVIILTFTLGLSVVHAQGDAELALLPSVAQAKQGDEFTVDIVLKNPSKQAVISVRSWLNYDPAALEGLSVDTSASPFTLSAPGEDTLSGAEGKVKIGRSNISGGVMDVEAKVATVRFKVQSAYAGKTTLSFYDYQVSELGHTSVNIIDEGFPLNVLAKAPNKLELQLNPGAAAAPAVTPYTPPAVTPVITQTEPIGGGGFAADLVRPLNLKANTGSGYIDLKWDAAYDPARQGFNIYYGQVSGAYTRRHTIGNVNAFRLEGLMNGQAYFMGVTAFDALNRESDYSNEVAIIVNQPLSSTAPFETTFDQTYRRIPEQPQNGPLVGWLLFSAAGLSGAILFGRRRQRIPITTAE